ncbi:hypothetical protein [Curtobacterium sp. 9128]|uniref:hypothetical protein n=1 Tax=Curtobacterium sp. 9128 TaxID=1793722 RepID=UPI0011A6ECC3|nr:hypothetical protein [Curtobacterium sp. 9128]
MSEETRQAVDAAQREYDEADQAERSVGRALIDAVAEALPARVEALARKAVDKNPDQVRKLGSEGMQKLRASLRSAAEEVAGQMRDQSGTPWRGSYAQSFGTSNYAVTSALEGLFGYPEKSKLQAPMRDAGFNTHPEPFPSEQLARTEDHTDMIAALTRATMATNTAAKKVDTARKANDAQDVADAWGD